MKTITLTIKKNFFEMILTGQKTHEYRSDVSFYRKLFQIKPDFVTFHYFSNRKLVVWVKSLKKTINTLNSDYVTGKKMFDIEIEPLFLVEKNKLKIILRT